MGNLTFLISAVITVFLLQGIEQGTMTGFAVSQENGNQTAIEQAKTGEISLKTLNIVTPSALKPVNLDPSNASFTKS